MSSNRNYSKESRSYYSRSSSSSSRNNRSNSSYNRQRPLSSLLIERDYSSPSLATTNHFDDQRYNFQRRSREFFDDFDRRLRSRWSDDFFRDDDDDFFKSKFGKNDSLDYQREHQINNSSTITRNIPVQYVPSSNYRREKVYRKLDNDNNSSTNSFQQKENRISKNDWSSKQKSPTRVRTSMTIFLRQPRIQYSDAPQQPHSTTYRTNYY